MAFKILTLNDELFAEHCHRLLQKATDGGFEPDLTVSIPRGGDVMAAIACNNDRHRNIVLVRNAKGGKIKRLLKPFFRNLPRGLNNLLRKVEAKYLMRRNNHMEHVGIILPDECKTARRILIIDDAVDTGATLKAVYDKIKQQNPEADVRMAVVTVTSVKPLIMPDYFLYNNRTLVRFPWSIDN